MEAEKPKTPPENDLEKDIVKAVGETPQKKIAKKGKLPLWLMVTIGLIIILGGLAATAFYLAQDNDSPSSEEEVVDPQKRYEGVDEVIEKKIEENKDNPDFAFVEYTAAAISEHNTPGDCWVVFEHEVYDISKWAYPGETPIDAVCGKTDARSHFEKDEQPKPPEEYFLGHYNYTGQPFED